MSLPSLPDEVILAARGGDPAAWSRIFEAFSPCVLSWCRYQGGAWIDPEDAAHEAFIRLHQRFDRLEDPARFRSFLYGITKRVVAEHRRRLWWRRWSPGPAEPRVDPRPGPEGQSARAEAARQIEAALERVPARYREVLVRSDVEGLRPREIAELMELPVNTVRSRLARARDRFRQEARRSGISLSQLTPEATHA